MPDAADEEARQAIRDNFLFTAAFEERMVAMRRLIEFLGICEKNGRMFNGRASFYGQSILRVLANHWIALSLRQDISNALAAEDVTVSSPPSSLLVTSM
jgi:hypothetical protein